jgi:Leucine-rich repeat (LRR) protein
MNRLLAVVALFLASCAGDPPAASASDAARIKEILNLAAAGPQENLRPRLEAITRTLQDPELRAKTSGALDEIVAAAALHRRLSDLGKEVTELGGLVTLEPGGPAWMRSLAGDPAMQLFDRLVTVSMNDKTNPHFKDYKLNPRVNDAWVERVAGLPDLRTLDIANMDVRGPGLRAAGTLRSLESINLTLTPITDESLAALSGLSRLKVLGLASTKVTGTGMEPLQGLKKLENLNFHSTPVNDAGLEWIGKMASLLRLEIVHTQFTDAGTRALSGLVSLERLQLGSRKATGAGLAFLRDLPKLRELDVHDGMLTPEGFRNVGAARTLRVLRAYGGSGGDEGLRALADLSELETLILEGVGVTDAGLETLSKLTHLRKLTLHEPKVTEAGAGKLRAALPSLEIAR